MDATGATAFDAAGSVGAGTVEQQPPGTLPAPSRASASLSTRPTPSASSAGGAPLPSAPSDGDAMWKAAVKTARQTKDKQAPLPPILVADMIAAVVREARKSGMIAENETVRLYTSWPEDEYETFVLEVRPSGEVVATHSRMERKPFTSE